MNSIILFDFCKTSKKEDWQVVNDGVMGGLSKGQFLINKEGNGLFQGTVSLANNGGFSLLRHRFSSLDTKIFSKFKIRLKGDGKTYQFRVKSTIDDRHSYMYSITTSTKWKTVIISFAEMHPTFRGRSLNQNNFSGEKMSEIAFLIGNKKNETFTLEIDSITLQ